MITRAKVNLVAVKSFHQSVSRAVDFSPEFERGISCIDQFHNNITEVSIHLRETIRRMNTVREELLEKIKELKAEIAKLTEQINKLLQDLSDLEMNLSHTHSTITIKDKDGNTHEQTNPKYEALKHEIAALKKRIASVKAELSSLKHRLEKTTSLDQEIVSQIKTVNNAIYILEDKRNTCKHMIEQLEVIKISNMRNGTSADTSLKKIEEIVGRYVRIKMKYNNVVDRSREQTIRSYSKEVIQEHNIRFDDSGRVYEYEGRSYGGKYHTYEDRLSKTPIDSSIYGKYEGVRGESKYIPSGRTVEGIAVKEILARYGVNGICYRNAEPDFEICSEEILIIDHMTSARYDYEAAEGILGNFTQADMKCAELWSLNNKYDCSNWTPQMVKQYRADHDLTWHEKCDMETMVMVPIAINAYFRHSGGVSECRARDAENSAGDEFDV